jgi:hypothetical protein
MKHAAATDLIELGKEVVDMIITLSIIKKNMMEWIVVVIFSGEERLRCASGNILLSHTHSVNLKGVLSKGTSSKLIILVVIHRYISIQVI